jgi:hypothetical protein
MTRSILAVAVVALVASIGGAAAQTYPSRPITMIAPFPGLPTRSRAFSPSRCGVRSASRW